MTSPRTILITGATDGLGRALAHRLTADGAMVVMHGRDQEKFDRTADELRDLGGAGRIQPSTPIWLTSLRSEDSRPKRVGSAIGWTCSQQRRHRRR